MVEDGSDPENAGSDEAPDLLEPPEATASEEPPQAESEEPPRRRPSRRTLGISCALVAIVAIIAIDLGSLRQVAKNRASSSASAATPAVSFDGAEPAEAPGAVPPVDESLMKSAPVASDDEDEPSEAPSKPKAKKTFVRGTVSDAAARSCSTASVAGLSHQIIVQARCIDAQAFVAVPARPNLVIASNVSLYLEAAARDRLLKALDANRNKTMTVNSALRTVAQQYLLRRWAAGKRCGIELATLPGESNHESGLALDIAEAAAWRAPLAAQDFHWLGSIDRVHFDYAGPDATSHSNVDVKAFQQLWNRNHPEDAIPENGRYTTPTEQRLERSPSTGFLRGPKCER